MAQFAFDQAGLITANSTALRDVAVHDLGADPAKFDLIAYGVDPNAFRPDPTGTAELRATWASLADDCRSRWRWGGWCTRKASIGCCARRRLAGSWKLEAGVIGAPHPPRLSVKGDLWA